MNSILKQQVLDTLADSGNQGRWIPELEFERLFQSALEKWTTSGSYQYPLWESMGEDHSSIQFAEAWQWLKNFTPSEPNKKIIVFFERSDLKAGLYFDAMASVQNFIAESPGFTYYISDENLTFLICENDHQFLIAAGDAQDWLESHSKTEVADRVGKDIVNYKLAWKENDS